MSFNEINEMLRLNGISIEVIDGRLSVKGPKQTLQDQTFRAQLQEKRGEILEYLSLGNTIDFGNINGFQAPPNLIGFGATTITPEMLTLVSLDQPAIDRIVATVPGGAANVQDIYPLAPLQEGILFHHLATERGDAYLLATLMSFASRETLDAYARAMDAVIARHDVLRTAVLWEGLPEPVQVVWRQASLVVEEVELQPDAGDAAEQLYERFDPRHYRLDVREAPMMRLAVAWDAGQERWLAVWLLHHLIMDHVALDVVQAEVRAHLLGREASLPAALPFRDFVAQTRHGLSSEENERFFGEMLGDVDEPTAPFGLLDVLGDGDGIDEARLAVEPRLGGRVRAQARALGVSAASLFHVAWGLVVGRASGRNDPVFGTVLFGRMQGGAGADRALGLFINTLPMRLRLGQTGAAQCVRETHALLGELMRHEHASLALAQRCSAVDGRTPLFTSLLNYRHSGHASLPSGYETSDTLLGLEGVRHLGSEERTNYPVTLSVDDLGAQFHLTAQVSHSVGAERLCEMTHRALESLVEALESHPAMPAGQLGASLLDIGAGTVKDQPISDPSRTSSRKAHAPMFEPPLGPLEEVLARVWLGVLEVERIGRRDNFFDLGGHSLLALRAVERLSALGVNVKLRDIYRTATLADLADVRFSDSRMGLEASRLEPA